MPTYPFRSKARFTCERSDALTSDCSYTSNAATTATPPGESGADPTETDVEAYARVRRLAFLALNQVNAADETTIAEGDETFAAMERDALNTSPLPDDYFQREEGDRRHAQ